MNHLKGNHRIVRNYAPTENQFTDLHEHKAKSMQKRFLGFAIHTYTLNVEVTLSLAVRTAASRSKDDESSVAAVSEAAA